MGDELVTEEVEVDPGVGGPALGTANELPVEVSGLGEVVDRYGEVESRTRIAHQAKGTDSSPDPSEPIGGGAP